MPDFLLPVVAAGLVIIAAFDVYRKRDHEKPKRKRKHDARNETPGSKSSEPMS